MMKRNDKTYPLMELSLSKLRKNIDVINGICKKKNIKIAGVIKGCDGELSVINTMVAAGIDIIASSRIRHLKPLKMLWGNTQSMLIRTPMLSEVDQVVEYCHISLNSDMDVLKALNQSAERQGVIHRIILMTDLGDLREGVWDKNELKKMALYVDMELKSLKLIGIGTNLGCYGSIKTTDVKMMELVAIAEAVEESIGRKLEYICGGGTMSLPLVLNDTMPERVNLLRLGESMLLAKDLENEIEETNQDAFVLKLEVIEIDEKPTYPVGEISLDGFGLENKYEDRGIRKRALLAGGKVDYGYPEMLIPTMSGVEVIGASSDHTIIDIQDAKDISIGDILTFELSYASLVFSITSEDVNFTICE